VSIEEGAEHFVDLAGIPEPQAVARIRKDQASNLNELIKFKSERTRQAILMNYSSVNP
jgi:hypothetical protein